MTAALAPGDHTVTISQPHDSSLSIAPRTPWWRGAVIYQVYPRSFLDGNGDGIGDLVGLAARLDHIASLGVDGLWLGPIFTSPMADFGYDVADYRSIDPIFGTTRDFDRLLTQIHDRKLRLILDMVLSHTSDSHPWFSESRSNTHNPKADWYVWADAKADGTPPNNWLSVFGGPAWQWEPRRGQYYLHNFLSAQPDLNLHHQPVQDAVLAEVDFWLQRGIDGCRLDVANYYFHDRHLRDNPARPPGQGRGDGIPEISPYGRQYHRYDKSQPETLAFLRRLRRLFDRYPGTMTVAEVHDDDSVTRAAEYVGRPDLLHTAYNFALLGQDFGADIIRRALTAFAAAPGNGWPAWAFSNHDVTRALSRWGGAEAQPSFAKMLVALLGCLRGTVFLYQGEELGLPEAHVPFDRLQDPFGLALWPVYQGRDGCRTPLPWNDTDPYAGFSTVEPWLPIPESHRSLSIAVQDADPDSVLTFTRRFLHWRKGQEVMRLGDITFADTAQPILAFTRSLGSERRFCAFNLSATARSLPAPPRFTIVWEFGLEGQCTDGVLSLPAHGAVIGCLQGT